MTFKVTRLDGSEVKAGDKVTSFRGEEFTFVKVTRGPVPGKSAKVMTRESCVEYYAGVFDLTVVEC